MLRGLLAAAGAAALAAGRLPPAAVAAVAAAARLARPGDVVLLSPASTSFARVKHFEERGRVFKDLVLALPE